jgi:hypothetical protein
MCGILDPRKDGFSDKRNRKKSKFKLMHLFFIDFWGQVVTSKALPPSNMSCMNISLDNSFFEGETKVNGPLCTTRNRNVFV